MTETAIASEVKAIFDQLVAERGGRTELSVTETALVRALALALTTDPIDPRAVAVLLEKLPAAKPKAKLLDLHRLTDRQLATLERLVAIANGEDRPKPKRGNAAEVHPA